MYTKLSIAERLKDLRVSDHHLTLEQLAEETGLSKSALGKYESDEGKDISPFAIVTLAKYYGVSTDYLLGLTEQKNHSDTELNALHLSDEMIALLKSGRLNHRLLCELATHRNFPRLMTDMEIFVDRIADMRVDSMNTILEAVRQEILAAYDPGEDDLYTRTLELAQIQESDFFGHVIHDDLDSILRDLRKAHTTDRTTADPQASLQEVKAKFQQAMALESTEQALLREFCDKMEIPYDKLTPEEFAIFMRILSKSRLLKKPYSLRGKPTPVALPAAKKRRKK